MLTLFLAVAQAGVVPGWSVDDFGDDVQLADGDWGAGYADDAFVGYEGYLVDVGDDDIRDKLRGLGYLS